MKNLVPSWIRVPVIFFIIFGAVEFFIDSGVKPAFIEYPAVLLFLLLVLLILIAIEAIVGALENVMLHKLDEEAKDMIPQFRQMIRDRVLYFITHKVLRFSKINR